MNDKVFKNNAGQEFKVIDHRDIDRKFGKGTYKQYLVKFIDTGFTKWVYRENALDGKVRDLYAKSVYGVGYSGDADKSLHYYKQARQLWQNMLKRCYCEKDLKGYYGTVDVEPRWHSLENFLNDLPKLNNFDKWLDTKAGNYNLDKDFKGDGTVYSFETCQFITEYENKSAGAKSRANGFKRVRGLVQN